MYDIEEDITCLQSQFLEETSFAEFMTLYKEVIEKLERVSPDNPLQSELLKMGSQVLNYFIDQQFNTRGFKCALADFMRLYKVLSDFGIYVEPALTKTGDWTLRSLVEGSEVDF